MTILSVANQRVKTIRLICPCGAVHQFDGVTLDDVIRAIDAAGWIDRAWTAASKAMPQGQAEGLCPTCEIVRVRAEAQS
jgi:hypothetical protein